MTIGKIGIILVMTSNQRNIFPIKHQKRLPRCQFGINFQAYYSSDISNRLSPSKRNETHLSDDRLHRRSVCIICSRYKVDSNLFHVLVELKNILDLRDR